MKLINYLFIFIFLISLHHFQKIQLVFMNGKKDFKKIALENNISEKLLILLWLI